MAIPLLKLLMKKMIRNKVKQTTIEMSLMPTWKFVAEHGDVLTRVQKHSLKFDPATSRHQAGYPEQGWNLLTLDQSVNLFCLGARQIDEVLIFKKSLRQHAIVNRAHPLFDLPVAIRMKIYAYLMPATTRKISLSPAFATKTAFGEGYFDDPFKILDDVSGALEAFQAIRHELMTYFWTQFHFHVTLSPFIGPIFSPLSTIWFMENLTLVQHLTLEVDFTKFGCGFLLGASEYGYKMKPIENMVQDIMNGLASRRVDMPMIELNLLGRRFAGKRRTNPTVASSVDVSSPTDVDEAPTSEGNESESHGRLQAESSTSTMAKAGRGESSVEEVQAPGRPPVTEATQKEADAIPYCPELATLLCDSISVLSGVVKKCRISGFTRAYTEMLLGSIFGQGGTAPRYFVARDRCWPLLPIPDENLETFSPRKKVQQTDKTTQSSSQTKQPSSLRRKVSNLKTSAINSFSKAGSRFMSIRSPKISTSWTSNRMTDLSSDMFHSPGHNSNDSAASASSPGSPIAASDPFLASAPLQRSFSSSGLRYSSIPMATSPLAHDLDSPATKNFRSPKLTKPPRPLGFLRSRLSLRSALRSVTAPHTPDTSYFPDSHSAVPSPVYTSPFLAVFQQSGSLEEGFEEEMRKYQDNTSDDTEGTRQNNFNIVEQGKTADDMTKLKSGLNQNLVGQSWYHGSEYDVDDEQSYATTPPMIDCPQVLNFQPDLVVPTIPRPGDLEQHDADVQPASVLPVALLSAKLEQHDVGSQLDLVFAAACRSIHLDAAIQPELIRDSSVLHLNSVPAAARRTSVPAATRQSTHSERTLHHPINTANTSNKMTLCTPTRQGKALPNSPNSRNILNEQDPGFVRSLDVRKLDSVDPGSRYATPTRVPATRPISYQHLNPDTSDTVGAEQCTTSLNRPFQGTRKSYLDSLRKARD